MCGQTEAVGKAFVTIKPLPQFARTPYFTWYWSDGVYGRHIDRWTRGCRLLFEARSEWTADPVHLVSGSKREMK